MDEQNKAGYSGGTGSRLAGDTTYNIRRGGRNRPADVPMMKTRDDLWMRDPGEPGRPPKRTKYRSKGMTPRNLPAQPGMPEED